MRTVAWRDNQLHMIDQRRLPWALEIARFDTAEAVAEAIRQMVVRGAPAIGAAAAFGMALSAYHSMASSVEGLLSDLGESAAILKSARPTAVNLAWAVDRVLRHAQEVRDSGLDHMREAVQAAAQRIADEDVEINRRMAAYGAALVQPGDTILHHCNTGALATVDWGTALGVIRMAHEQGKRIHVLLDETRPRLQGSRLSAWELKQYGVPFDIIADNAAGHFMRTGQVNLVLVGSDRTAANGDVANKIGTYKLAVVAQANDIPFYAVVPTSTVDLNLSDGDAIPIEERPPDEIRALFGQAIIPDDYPARNPAFDVTPNRYVTGIVTENGIAYPPLDVNLAQAVAGKQLQPLPED